MKALLVVVGLVASTTTTQAASMTPHLSEHNCVSGDFLSQAPTDEVRGVVASGQRDFSVNLIKNMFNVTSDVSSNIFVSPSSIFQTLMMAYFGAGGATEQELAQVMGVADMDKLQVMKAYLYDKAFQTVREKNEDKGYSLIHANRLFFDRSVPLNKCIQLLLNNELGAVDFQQNPEKARKQINSWVEGKTHKKIQELLPAGTVDASTQMSLVNAAYFKGQWMSQFKPSDTKINNFYVKRDKIKIAKFMKQKGSFNYYLSEELRAHVLQIPYQGESISMVIILPPFEDDAIHETIRRMTPKTVQGVMAEIKSGFYKADNTLTIEIPKFNIEQTMELSGMVASLGAPSLFGGQADLTGFLREDQTTSADLTLNSAVHKSYIEVNEEGSEAAAATALFGFRSARPLFHTEFVANHPFVFFIYDEQTDIILFHGVLQDPTVNF